MKFPGALAPQLNLMRNVDHRRLVGLFHFQRVAQEILALVRHRRPFNHFGVRRGFAHGKRKPDMTHGCFRRNGPASDAARFTPNRFDPAQHIGEIC
jgi:hypothetical protein